MFRSLITFVFSAAILLVSPSDLSMKKGGDYLASSTSELKKGGDYLASSTSELKKGGDYLALA